MLRNRRHVDNSTYVDKTTVTHRQEFITLTSTAEAKKKEEIIARSINAEEGLQKRKTVTRELNYNAGKNAVSKSE